MLKRKPPNGSDNEVKCWYNENRLQIYAFKESLRHETDYLKKKVIYETFFNKYFELKRMTFENINQPRNSNQEKKEIQSKIDKFISHTIGLPQGDLSLEINEAGVIETDCICLKENGSVAGVFTGWPQIEQGPRNIIFYNYLCASHPDLPELGLGTRLYENFFEINEEKQAKGEFFYNKFIGAVNPFGREACLHLHKLGAISKAVIERNRSITEKFSYYGGISPHRIIVEFTIENYKLARKRLNLSQKSSLYTPKPYTPPIESTIINPNENLSSFTGKLEKIKKGFTFMVRISAIGQKFHHLNLTDSQKLNIEKESSVFYDNCLILFANHYQIVDCLYDKKNQTTGYVFAAA